MKLPPVNATLTRVSNVELVSDGGGGFEETLIVKWEGSAPAYSTEKTTVEAGSTGPVAIYVAQVVIPSTVPVDAGDTLDYIRNGRVEVREVDGVEDRSDFGFTRCFVKESA